MRFAVAAVAIVVGFAGCVREVCAPGKSEACVGPGGCVGGQRCVDDGTAFEECVCAGEAPEEPDGGVQESIVCEGVTCRDYQECVDVGGNAICVDSELSLQWVDPAQSVLRYDAGVAAIPVRIQVLRAAGKPVLLQSLPVTLPGGAIVNFSRDGALPEFSGVLDLPVADGQYLFTAGWPNGGPHASFTVIRDTKAPQVVLSVAPAPTRVITPEFTDEELGHPRAFKRDEFVELRVGSDEPIVVTSAHIHGLNPASTVSPAACTDCPQAVCTCFSVDLAALIMNGGHQTYTVELDPVIDLAGNRSAGSVAAFEVTRWRWSRNIRVTSTDYRPSATYTPTVAPDGTVYVGVEQTEHTGVLWAVNPDGTTVSGFDGSSYGAITASPVIGRAIYVAANDMSWGRIVALNPRGAHMNVRCRESFRRFKSALAIQHIGEHEEAVMAVSEETAPTLCAGRFFNSDSNCKIATLSSGLPDAYWSVVSDDDAAYVASTGSRLSRVPWSEATPLGYPGWLEPTWTVDHGMFTSGLIRVGSIVGGGGVGLPAGGVYAMQAQTLENVARHVLQDDSYAAGPVVAGSFVAPRFVFGRYGGGIRSVALESGLDAPPVFGEMKEAEVEGVSRWSGVPAVGSDQTIYAVATSGRITALSPELDVRWSLELGAEVDSSPALDTARLYGVRVCNRPGTLYIAAEGTGRLYSIIVDSHGLSGTAPWPTYQHDNARTGNSARSLNDWSCP